MYCRNCGATLDDKAEFCIKCGVRPLSANAYCQECGTETTAQQEICVKCGRRLKIATSTSAPVGGPGNILDGINIGSAHTAQNLDFSSLSPYYQEEFQKIYNSNGSYKGKFNGCAFLFSMIWAFTKGCWLSAVVCLLASLLTAGTLGFVYWFIFGFRGNYMYYCSFVNGKQCIF